MNGFDLWPAHFQSTKCNMPRSKKNARQEGDEANSGKQNSPPLNVSKAGKPSASPAEKPADITNVPAVPPAERAAPIVTVGGIVDGRCQACSSGIVAPPIPSSSLREPLAMTPKRTFVDLAFSIFDWFKERFEKKDIDYTKLFIVILVVILLLDRLAAVFGHS